VKARGVTRPKDRGVRWEGRTKRKKRDTREVAPIEEKRGGGGGKRFGSEDERGGDRGELNNFVDSLCKLGGEYQKKGKYRKKKGDKGRREKGKKRKVRQKVIQKREGQPI